MASDLDLSIYPYMPHGALWMGTPTTDIWTWTPASLITLEGTPDELNALQAAGWQRFLSDEMSRKPDMSALTMLRLRGQLADLRLVRKPGQEQRELWARAEDIARMATTPVVLAFSVSKRQDYAGTAEAYRATEDMADIRVIQMLPPPQFGEIAIVFFEDEGAMKWQHYTLAALGDEGVVLWQRLGAALQALAAPAEWWPYSSHLATAIAPEGYEALTSWLRHHPADPRKWPNVHAHAYAQARGTGQRQVTLNAARQARRYERTIADCARAIQTARGRAEQNRDEWLRQWQDIQHMVQELAALYWQAHQATIKVPVVDATPSESPEEESEAQPPLTPVVASAGEDIRILARITEVSSFEHLATPSYAEDRAVREAALAATGHWKAEANVPYIKTSNNLAVYFLDPKHPLSLADAQAQLRRISPRTLLYLRVARALWNLRRHDARSGENGQAFILYDEVLHWCDVPKHRRPAYPGSRTRFSDGYRTEDREEVRRSFELGSRLQLRGQHTVLYKGKPHQLNVDSQYVTMASVSVQTLWGDQQVGAWLAPGGWQNEYERVSRDTCKKVPQAFRDARAWAAQASHVSCHSGHSGHTRVLQGVDQIGGKGLRVEGRRRIGNVPDHSP
jgi:hypothetical protein